MTLTRSNVQLPLPKLKAPAYTRPTMELGTAAGALEKACPGITEDQIRELIERGALWAWDVSLHAPTLSRSNAPRSELRLLTRSVAAFAANPDAADLLTDPYALLKPEPATAEAAVQFLLDAIPSRKAPPALTGSEIKQALVIRRTHMIALVDAKVLPQMPGTQYRTGPNGYPFIARETLAKFLGDRLVC